MLRNWDFAQTSHARRRLLLALGGAAMALPPNANALSLADLSSRDASAGLKAALEQGATIAVQLLGKTDGFWANELVRIALPEWLQKAESALKLMGRGGDVDELKLGVNRAAEQAVPEAKALLINAVRAMTVQDAKGILGGGDNSVTQFFADKTRQSLNGRFLPIVTRVTERIGLARQYNGIAAQVEQFGVLKPEQARIERHVTAKALDGLYFMIGEEEKKIRANPAAAGKDIVRKVFGSLK